MSLASLASLQARENTIPNWNKLYKISAISALSQLVIVITYFIIIATLGGRPVTVEEYFTVMQNNRLVGLLRGDIMNLLIIIPYLGLFPGLYLALKRVNPIGSAVATLLTFIAVILCFASNSDFSMMHLSDQYAMATSEAHRSQLLAAGEAIIASDMWNSTGSYISGIFLQGSGVLISAIMLRSKNFSKVTAFAGILGNGFDLLQHILHPFLPATSEIVLRIAGPFYLSWFPMMVRDFLRMRQSKD
jgi:hypothetical protein